MFSTCEQSVHAGPHRAEDDHPDRQRARKARGGRAGTPMCQRPCRGAHLFGAVVLDERVQWHHTADLQQHRGGAQLLLAWAAAEVAGRRTAAFLLTADLHPRDELVIRQHLGGQQA